MEWQKTTEFPKFKNSNESLEFKNKFLEAFETLAVGETMQFNCDTSRDAIIKRANLTRLAKGKITTIVLGNVIYVRRIA